MSDHHRLEDLYLQRLCEEQVPVSIFLVNGIKLHGVLGSFDGHIVMLKSAISQMVYKHAISTVVPSRTIDVMLDDDD